LCIETIPLIPDISEETSVLAEWQKWTGLQRIFGIERTW
jgi:hypothetical protein